VDKFRREAIHKAALNLEYIYGEEDPVDLFETALRKNGYVVVPVEIAGGARLRPDEYRRWVQGYMYAREAKLNPLPDLAGEV
jgi:hypothetical protein